jgi:MFS superfamily sulfate permease-like transporter
MRENDKNRRNRTSFKETRSHHRSGIFCILAGWLRLAFVVDFLTKPIPVGFLNGVAIHIFIGQIGKVFGFSMTSHDSPREKLFSSPMR